jgi:subtilisin family serine protease
MRPAGADSVRDAQLWVLNDLWAPRAWMSSEGRGVTVAVLDSGVNPSVSDLAGSVRTGPDFTDTGTPATNPHWGEHGTWMASLIAGHGHAGGGSGILGIAPESKILSIRVITDHDDPGYGHYQHEPANKIQESLASAIRYAVDQGSAVISMSIGYSSPSTVVRAALQYASDHGTVVVASSGNSGDTSFAHSHSYAPYSFPADYPGVVAVGAANRNGSRAGFSSDNLSVQVAAPGVNVPAQGRDGQYWQVSGTSPACALVAGVVALIKSLYPSLPPALVSKAIVATTHYRPARGYNDGVGFGMVDAAAALAAAKVFSGDFTGVAPQVQTSSGTGQAIGAGQHFGGGPSRVAGPPVGPRGILPLAGFGLLGLVSLALIVAALARVMARHSLGHAPAAWRDPDRPADFGAQSAAPAVAVLSAPVPPPPQAMPVPQIMSAAPEGPAPPDAPAPSAVTEPPPEPPEPPPGPVGPVVEPD